MVYKTAQQKILIALIIVTFFITVISGTDYWKMWSVLPISFFFLYCVGKLTRQKYNVINLREQYSKQRVHNACIEIISHILHARIVSYKLYFDILSFITLKTSYSCPYTLYLDMLFMDDRSYMYEPNYVNWKDVNEPDY